MHFSLLDADMIAVSLMILKKNPFHGFKKRRVEDSSNFVGSKRSIIL